MNWFIAVPLGWAVVAVVLGLLVGNGIRMECGIEPEARVGTEEVGTARVGSDRIGADQVSVPAAASEAPAPAGAVGSTAGAERAAVQVRQAVLTGAR